MPLPDLGPRPGPARKTPDPDHAEAGHSFRQLIDRHAETAPAEEGGADEPSSPDAPSDQDADEVPDDPFLAAAFAAIPSPAKDASGELLVLPTAAPMSQQVQGTEIKAAAAPVAILSLGAASNLSSQQAAVAAALFGGKAPLAVSGPNASPAGDAINQQPPAPVAAQAPIPAIPVSTAVLTQDPAISTAPELTQAAGSVVRPKPTVAAPPATATENVGSKSLPNLVNQPSITVVAAQAAPPAEAVGNDTGVVQPAKPVLPQVPQLKKETDAATTLVDTDAQQSGAPTAPSFDGFTVPGPLTDSPREVANHYNRVGDAAHRALSDGTMAPADQVSLRLIHGISEGRRAIQVQLHPAELGSIDIKMHWQGDRLTAQFVVDRPETLDLLQRDARALERALGGAGIDLSDSGLSFSLRDQGTWQQEGRVPSATTADASSLGEPQEIAADEPLGQIVRDGIISIRV
jgi:flagellar hook-length control protein FliK